ncbi:MAG: starch synthase [Spirochaetaceae bacterium 4572_59]|nr:MAG: starch synthase [Spirochaetaceae bacterium 4572_59]
MSYRILMITSEAVPFAKSGGLADMVSALSIELYQSGSDVRILMPLYGFISKEELKLIDPNFEVSYKNYKENCALYEGKLPLSKIPVYFLDSAKFYERNGIYGPTASSAYPDNGLRYSLLSRAALQLGKRIDWNPQIFHSHDWPTGLNPVYLKLSDKETSSSKCASVFTIHNLGYQGRFSMRNTPWAGITPEIVHQYHFEDQNRMNYLKAGIENSDMITTVSPTYASEIQTKDFGHGLDPILSRRSKYLKGIVNGVDYNDWNPEIDKHIVPHNYSLADPDGKKALKKQLQKEMGLEISTSKPLFAMISRLVEQKGIEELCGPGNGVLEGFCKNNDVQLVILGTGEKWCETELKRLGEELDNLSVTISYNDYLSHLIEAGADFFMMPSRYEPCGLNQLYSLKYGTLPIVRRTGGLADTVQAPDKEDCNGTGFLFDEISPEAFLAALEKACSYWYEKPAIIEQMKILAMEQDFSWGPSAEEYLKVYKEALTIASGK